MLWVAFAAGLVLPSTAHAAGDGGGLADFAWRVANFLLLLGVLYWFARKPIQAYFEERRDRIQGDVETAARLQHEAEERHEQLQGQLAQLDADLEQIRSTARDRAQAEGERIIEDARTSALRIREDARLAIDQELRRAREELRREASDLSIEMAADLLRGEVRDSDRDRLVDEFIEKVEHSATNGSGS